ncbi:hypothetical protein N9A45_00370 [bacterium]|nr:hypothetical protein [bacterium]
MSKTPSSYIQVPDYHFSKIVYLFKIETQIVLVSSAFNRSLPIVPVAPEIFVVESLPIAHYRLQKYFWPSHYRLHQYRLPQKYFSPSHSRLHHTKYIHAHD